MQRKFTKNQGVKQSCLITLEGRAYFLHMYIIATYVKKTGNLKYLSIHMAVASSDSYLSFNILTQFPSNTSHQHNLVHIWQQEQWKHSIIFNIAIIYNHITIYIIIWYENNIRYCYCYNDNTNHHHHHPSINLCKWSFLKQYQLSNVNKTPMTFHEILVGLWRDPTAACQICSLKIAG